MRFPIVLAVAPMLLGLAGLVPAGAQQLPPSGFEPGEPFPEVSLPRLDGSGSASLASVRGRKVVLHVFASW